MEKRTVGGLVARAAGLTVYVLAVAGLVFLAGCGDQAGSGIPTSPAAARNGALSPNAAGPALARAGSSGPLIQLVDIKVSRFGLGTIDPCWLVNRGIYNADVHNGKFTLEFSFTYLSRGEQVTRAFTINVRNGETEPPEPEREEFGANVIELTNSFDLGDAIPDSPGDIVGSVVLVKTSGETRSLEGESSLTAHQ